MRYSLVAAMLTGGNNLLQDIYLINIHLIFANSFTLAQETA